QRCRRSGLKSDWPRRPEPRAMTVHAAGSVELQRTQARVWFEELRDRICLEVEALEREAPADLFPQAPASFVFKPWKRTSREGGGGGGFLEAGRLLEKAPVRR